MEFLTQFTFSCSVLAIMTTRPVSVQAAINKLMDDKDDSSDYVSESEQKEEIIDDHELESMSSGNIPALHHSVQCSAPAGIVSTANRPSFLSVLNPPRLSELSRKRIIDRTLQKEKNEPKGKIAVSPNQSLYNDSVMLGMQMSVLLFL